MSFLFSMRAHNPGDESKMIRPRPKDAFPSVRVDPARKTRIQAAAAVVGASVGNFVRTAAEEAARDVLLRELSVDLPVNEERPGRRWLKLLRLAERLRRRERGEPVIRIHRDRDRGNG